MKSLEKTKRIKLGNGGWAIVDASDYPSVKDYKWYAKIEGTNQYVARSILDGVTRTTMRMQVHILGKKNGLVIDHINHNGLDNRRSNLRFVTQRENTLNTRSKKMWRGVHAIHAKSSGMKWFAQLSWFSKKIYLGSFRTKQDAAIAYDMAALMWNGNFAKTNILIPLSEEWLNPKT